MIRHLAVMLTMVLIAAAGCNGRGAVAPVRLRNDSEFPPAVQTRDMYDYLSELAPFEEPAGTRFFSPDKAAKCPSIKVRDGDGKELRLQPGSPGSFALVVFWNPGIVRDACALQHVHEVAHTYRRFGVRGISVAQKTKLAGRAPAVANAVGATLPIYYDDASMSALRAMAGKVEAERKTAVPAIFITDRQGRLRFYRPGFAFTINPHDPRRRRILTENAPPGKSIEDYLKRLIEEG